MKRSAVGPYFGEASVHQKPINESVFRWGVGPSLTGDSNQDHGPIPDVLSDGE